MKLDSDGSDNVFLFLYEFAFNQMHSSKHVKSRIIVVRH